MTDIATKLVHGGERRKLPDVRSVSTPIYASATFTYDSMEEIDQVFGGEKQGFVYTRYGNPTTSALEEVVRDIEEGAVACAYATGMAAVHAALLACDMKSGSTVLASQDLYGATTNLLNGIFVNFGVKTVNIDYADISAVREKARELRPQIMIAETISNPLLKVCDIEACVEIARENGARLIVDNTFATPYLRQPLKMGADIVVHSATKYFSGHADAMGGVVVSRDEMDGPALVSVMKLVGGVLGVWDAHEILRGMKTLAVRMERQCENARKLAGYLSEHSRVGRVHYPGLGALVSIELRDNTKEAAFRFMNALKMCVLSTSLGDVFTSMLHPATASHRDFTPARRQQVGIADGLVRISVGIEKIDDIISDIDQALSV
ncbi:MAG TPA: PLP-dependent aspartate aminotransferase family protein [Pyrinomonadaceae bacterium]|jgi:cystathionine gamma-synthase/methionine-gamma-lyase|nr:PLP-dependent aspartate aminotransferase family protein [Pyrinomonadaceae bacterium]